jgi:hypothetical protein
MVWLKLMLAPAALPPAAVLSTVRPRAFRSTAPVTVTVSPLVVMVVKAAAAPPCHLHGIGRRAARFRVNWFWL